jgi:hypothetical protein
LIKQSPLQQSKAIFSKAKPSSAKQTKAIFSKAKQSHLQQSPFPIFAHDPTTMTSN